MICCRCVLRIALAFGLFFPSAGWSVSAKRIALPFVPLAAGCEAVRPGDVLVYSQVFETENHPIGLKGAAYRVRYDWLVKAAVLGRRGTASDIAVQYNLRKIDIQGMAALERSVGRAAAQNFVGPYQNVNPALVRYLEVDDLGNILNQSYNVNLASSNVYSFMMQIARSPGIPLEGSVQIREEDVLDVRYVGEVLDGRGSFGVYEGRHPSGWSRIRINRISGLTDRLEYEAGYAAANQSRRERYLLIFEEKRNSNLLSLAEDPDLAKAFVLASLANPELVCDRNLIRSLLASPDVERQNLAAAYCSLRGIPAGLELSFYLKAKNPIVRFNAAKALYKFQGEAGPMRNLTLAKDPYLRSRAVNFFERSTYMVPSRLHSLFASARRWLYDGSPLPDIAGESASDLDEAMQYMKPVNSLVYGCYKKFLEGGADFEHPYYLCLPEDYDPAETYPLLVYLGMGDGRGDIALKAITDALRRSDRLSRYVLLVPQAHGKWWEAGAENAFLSVLKTVLGEVSVDTNAIFLAGSSNGGMGTLFYGTHLPDRFTALASNMGYPAVERAFFKNPPSLESLKNLFNGKVFLSHGSKDDQVTPQGDRQASLFLRNCHVPVTYVELPRKGHDIEIGDILERALEVFDSQKRNPFPKRIDFLMNESEFPSCYWITIKDYDALPAKVTAKIDGNTVDILTTGIREMRLFLNDHMVDLAKPVRIRINDKAVFEGPLNPSAANILWSTKERSDAQLAFSVALDLEIP